MLETYEKRCCVPLGVLTVTLSKVRSHAPRLGVCVQVLLATPAIAFSVGTWHGFDASGVADPNHEEITLEALREVSVHDALGNELRFTQTAMKAIKAANVDTDSKYSDVSKYHFDAETFRTGSLNLYNLRSSIQEAALRGEFPAAQRLLGKALHGVQDFFSHTTWVEKKFAGRPGLGSAGISFDVATGPTCTIFPTQQIDGKATGIISGPELTGEYSDLATIYGSPIWKNIDDKCIHGSPFLENSGFNGAGINKDTAARDFHKEAKVLAISESVFFVHLVLGSIAGDETAVRGLMGLEPRKEIVLVSRPGATSTVIYGVNKHGVAVGVAGDGSSSPSFAWDRGVFTSLPSDFVAKGISDDGTIAGTLSSNNYTRYSGALYKNGKFIAEFRVAGMFETEIRAISPDGKYIAGEYFAPSTEGGGEIIQYGFVHNRDTGITKTIGGFYENFTHVYGVNSRGRAVVDVFGVGDASQRFIFDSVSGKKTIVEETEIDGKLVRPRPRAINDSNDIAGLVNGYLPFAGFYGRTSAITFVGDPSVRDAQMIVYGMNVGGGLVGSYYLNGVYRGFVTKR